MKPSQSNNKNVYLVSIARTPVTKANKGAFVNTRPDDLLAHVIQSALVRCPQVKPEDIEDVIVGCAMPEGEQGLNIARIGALVAGLPDTVPGMTINRYCSSGLQSIAIAHDRIATGQADVILAGGVESMSLVPMGGNKLTANPAWYEKDKNIAIGYGMGITAEIVAERYQISREAQDLFSLESHQKAVLAQKENLFNTDCEIAPIKILARTPDLKNQTIKILENLVFQDEGPRSDTSLEKLAQLKSAFMEGGSVTAGNSSQVSDGAAMVILVSEEYLEKNQIKPLAKMLGYSVKGVPPEVMGIGPIAAIPDCLKKCGLKLEDIDWIELNEAFAAQSLAVIKTLGLDPKKVNPHGGAIALGHPLGATGAIRVGTLVAGLKNIKNIKKSGKKYGMVTMCIGTGMGACGIFEVLV